MSCALADLTDWDALPSNAGPASPRNAADSAEENAVEVRAIFGGVVTQARILSLADAPARGRKGRKRRQFTIGSDAGVDAPVAAAFVPWSSHPLVMAAGAGYVVNVTPQMNGRVRVGGQVHALASFTRANGNTFALPPSASAQLDCGATSFIIASTSPPRRLPVPLVNVDWRQQRYTVASAAALAILLLVVSFIPEDPRALSLDLLATDHHWVSSIIKPPVEQPELLPPWLRSNSNSPAAGGAAAGRSHAQQPGAMGANTAPRRDTRFAVRGRQEEQDVRLARLQAIETIRSAGVLGVLKAVPSSKLASIFGDEQALGSEAEDVLGHLHGTTIAATEGPGGPGDLGTGADAAGTGERLIGGDGVLNTVGTRYPGGPGGPGYGRTVGGLRPRVATPPQWLPGIATVRGSLDKEIVRRVIRQHLNEIKYCYEQELGRNPSLAGRMVVQFTITANGQVVTSALQSSTMANARVENCTVQAVRRWQFPQPQGGGLVMVSYPFVLAPAGG